MVLSWRPRFFSQFTAQPRALSRGPRSVSIHGFLARGLLALAAHEGQVLARLRLERPRPLLREVVLPELTTNRALQRILTEYLEQLASL